MRRKKSKAVYQQPPTTIRFSFAELERFLYYQRGIDPAMEDVASGHRERLLTDGRIARMTGHGRACVNRWRATGDFNLQVASKIADTLGVHGWEIWPNYYDDIDLDQVKELA